MEYKLKRSKRKTISIHINKNKEVTIKAPLYLSMEIIEIFVSNHEKWIKRKLESIDKQRKTIYKLQQEGKTLFEGEEFTLVEGDNRDFGIERDKQKIYLSSDKEIKLLYLQEMKKAVEILIPKWSSYGRANKIFLKAQKTIWGSCTASGDINLNYHLVKAPFKVIEYIYLHELVHLKIKNHSKVFWQEVERLMPDYKQWKNWLKLNGHLLFL
ncbi:MAG: M48 family metallopeptidase [Fusobacteria bacterium]|nr:M48 family metallopeptidase [Fusobacteriota bacterium]